MTRARLRAWLRRVEIVFWCAAVALLGIYGYVYLERSVYQAYESWSFDRARTGAPASSPKPVASRRLALRPGPGSLIGRIEIPRARVSAMIAEGTVETVLRRAVGHIEGTALPGEPGNAALAGHRDTFFRGLRRMRRNDTITVTTVDGVHHYVVDSIRIVGPSAIDVLDPSPKPTLTLVTCYPFDYVGAAPRRFIVRASGAARQSRGRGARPGPGAAGIKPLAPETSR